MKIFDKKLKKFFPIKYLFFNLKEEVYFYCSFILFIFFPELIYKVSGNKFSISNTIRWKEEKNPENEWFYYKNFISNTKRVENRKNLDLIINESFNKNIYEKYMQ